MSIRENLLMRAFGRPRGLLGRIGGRLMLRGKADCGRWLVDALDLPKDARVLEIGCGPGVLLGLFAQAVPEGRVVGIDPSATMLRQARRRNEQAIRDGRIELLRGEAEAMPVGDEGFDVVVTLNSMQLWHDLRAGVRECRRALRSPGKLCVGFTPEAGRPPGGMEELLRAQGFGPIETKEGGGATWTMAARH